VSGYGSMKRSVLLFSFGREVPCFLNSEFIEGSVELRDI
jgi:hypothetical protein